MRCPYCSAADTKVIDSRLANDSNGVRRRRECLDCHERFTTYERSELPFPSVKKNDGTLVEYSDSKLRTGMMRALEKRPVETRRVEHAIRSLLREISTVEDSEIPSALIGEWVMRELVKLDQVAYVRFASVYKRFEDVQAFRDVIERLEREPPVDEEARQGSLLETSAKRSRRKEK